MKPMLCLAVGLVIAAASCAGPPKGAVIMSNNPGTRAAQDERDAFAMRPLRLADAPLVDAVKLVEVAGQPTLLYSTRVPDGGPYDLVIKAVPVADPARASQVASIAQMLPPPS